MDHCVPDAVEMPKEKSQTMPQGVFKLSRRQGLRYSIDRWGVSTNQGTICWILLNIVLGGMWCSQRYNKSHWGSWKWSLDTLTPPFSLTPKWISSVSYIGGFLWAIVFSFSEDLKIIFQFNWSHFPRSVSLWSIPCPFQLLLSGQNILFPNVCKWLSHAWKHRVFTGQLY